MTPLRVATAVAAVCALAAAVVGVVAMHAPARPAPLVHYTRLDGRPADLAALRGHVVLVNFWATDCGPCVAEMPRMASIWRRLSPQGFDTLAVAMEDDPPFAVVDFTRSRQLPFTVAIDHDGSIARSFGGVRYTPTSVLIDKHGDIVAQWIGQTDFDALERQVVSLLRS